MSAYEEGSYKDLVSRFGHAEALKIYRERTDLVTVTVCAHCFERIEYVKRDGDRYPFCHNCRLIDGETEEVHEHL